jgi:hypothetical protein
MPNTFELIASSTVGSGGASDITFSSIASTWTDLVVVVSARASASAANTNLQMQFNGSTSSYTQKELYGTGSAAGSASLSYISLGYISGNTATASSFGSCQAYIPNYASSNYKSVSSEGVAEGNITGMYMAMDAGLWSNTAAITSIKLIPASPDYFLQYSTAYLYGVKNA